LRRPVVMELGHIGATEDTALVTGFLLMLLSEQLQSTHRRLTAEQRASHLHLTVVDEAHRWLGNVQSSSDPFRGNPLAMGREDFSNALGEWRGFHEGLLMADQMPHKLVDSAVGNSAIKIMHWLEAPESYELFCSLLNLDERQRVKARILGPGEAITRSGFGHPVHVRVPDYNRTRHQVDSFPPDLFDEVVVKFMTGRYEGPTSKEWWPDPLERYYEIPERDKVFSLPREALMARLQDIANAVSARDYATVKVVCREVLTSHGLPAHVRACRCLLAILAAQPAPKSAEISYYEAFGDLRAALANFPLNDSSID
jgi:hypothetical protein